MDEERKKGVTLFACLHDVDVEHLFRMYNGTVIPAFYILLQKIFQWNVDRDLEIL